MLAGKFAVVFIFMISLLISGLSEAKPRRRLKRDEEHNCGYKSCHAIKPNMLNVHLVPHTHDDVGWLKTVDQYYYGSQTLIQKAGVQYIIDSVVDALLTDPNRRFIYVESAFFFKWWAEQTPEKQEAVKMLVNEGRLEFIGGAWSMNDEATTHYQSVIDQFSWGLRLLNDTFGECGRPKIGWQIDPFGHSREMASIFAQMGFDGYFFGRLDYQDKNLRLMTKSAEMIWRGSANLDVTSSSIFTGALFNTYQPPPGFCFDILCADEPIIDNKHSPDYNVERRVDDFFKFLTKQSHYYRTNNIILTMGSDFTYQAASVNFKNLDKLIRSISCYCLFHLPYVRSQVDDFLKITKAMAKTYRTNNLLITMGEDFHYQNANLWYKNLDKLIKYANERQANGSNINLLYSTPSCYLKSLHDAGLTWPTKDDDFFPYASDPHSYWTGYFSSRPTLKRYERVGNEFLQICKQLTALALPQTREFDSHLSFLRKAMGVMQHHDAVTGTEKEKVAYDYAKLLSVGLRACGANTRSALNKLTTKAQKQKVFDFKTCSFLNISSCAVSEISDRFTLTLYNPLAHTTSQYIRVPVPDINYEVVDANGILLEIQFVPIPKSILKLKFRESVASYELVFLAADLPPLGYKTYFIQKSPNAHMNPVPQPAKRASMTSIGNANLRLIFDTNGFLSAVTADGMTRTVSQEFVYYEAFIGNNKEHRNRSSGAYIFRPKTDQTRFITDQPQVVVYKGDLVEEVHQIFNEWVSQVIRIYRTAQYAEFEWLVGPIPVKDNVGKEIVTRFNSDILSDGIFYTDSNGREMLKRKLNHRDTWRVKLLEPTAGNYYPITTKIALEDENARMAILTDRAQGGSSLGSGSLELMVHRRLLHDDDFGVGEALNETAYGEGLIARGKHYFVFGASSQTRKPTLKAVERFTQLEQLLPPWYFFSEAEKFTMDDWRIQFKNVHSGIMADLPKNIHLLTIEPWHDHELLIRLEHILEKDDDPSYSKLVQFNLLDVLRGVKIVNMRETTLDGNEWLADRRRMEFVPEDDTRESRNYVSLDKDGEELHLLKGILGDPLLDTIYSIPDLSSNRLRRDLKEGQLNRLHAEYLRSKQIETMDIGTEFISVDNENDYMKYIIELSPMQIRTYVISLAKEK